MFKKDDKIVLKHHVTTDNKPITGIITNIMEMGNPKRKYAYVSLDVPVYGHFKHALQTKRLKLI